MPYVDTQIYLHNRVTVPTASIQKVCARYKASFAKLRAAPAPTTPEARLAYTHLLESVYDVHSSTLVYIAKGLHEIRTAMAQSRDEFADRAEIQKIFDEFFLSRIGIRMVSLLVESDFPVNYPRSSMGMPICGVYVK
jgi:hypothetical protein